MIIESIKEAKSLEEAVLLACEELGKDRMDVSEEVLCLPKKGLFGSYKQLAKVRVYYEIADAKPEKKAQAPKHEEKKESKPVKEVKEVKQAPAPKIVDSELGNKKITVAQNYLTNILNAMGLEGITQTVVKSEKSAIIRLDGDGLGAIIGRRGETLDAIQYLVSLVCCRKESEDYRVYIDCGNFREKREETLRELAAKVAKQVQKNGRNTTLEPMNPYERRIIHSVISEIPGLFSRSTGEEPHRKVVIMLEKNKNYNPKPRNRK